MMMGVLETCQICLVGVVRIELVAAAKLLTRAYLLGTCMSVFIWENSRGGEGVGSMI